MKFNKIFAAALSVLALSSCSDGDDYPNFLGSVNSEAGVTVSVPTTFTANESEAPFYIPINVAGTTNGKVVVTVEVSEATAGVDTEAAKEVEHYNVTSKVVNIASGESTGKVEVYPVWEQGVINNDRVFNITITSAEGAQVSNATCQVTIANVDDAYTMMLGKWKFTAKDIDGEDYACNLTFTTPSTDDEYYGMEYYAIGIDGYDFMLIPFNFEYDVETEKVTMSIQVGTPACSGVINFGSFSGVLYGASAHPEEGEDIPVTVTDFSEISVAPTARWTMQVYNSATGALMGRYNEYTNMHFEKL